MEDVKFALLGKRLSHSFSASYFEEKFKRLGLVNYSYSNLELDDLSLLRDKVKEVKGFNVTIPYKETVIPYLDELDLVASEVGAVNTVKVLRNKEGEILLRGFNTDVYGFHQLIKPFFKSRHERALILGTGGAAKAVAYLLKKQYGVSSLLVSRGKTRGNVINWRDVNDNVVRFHKMIVNTTPLGMFPNVDTAPEMPMEEIGEEHLVIDLVYNPEQTLFLKRARDCGAVTLGGLTMLHQQAEKAWEIWNTDENGINLNGYFV